jgi:hypothetical protein
MLNINCWVLGDDPERVFSIKIAKSETIDVLKDAIKEKKKPVFDDIAADSLDLLKVSVGCRCDTLKLTTSNFARRKST